jgi:hypothetical protein
MHPFVRRSGVLGVEIITIGCEEELMHSLTHVLTHSLHNAHSLTHAHSLTLPKTLSLKLTQKRSANLASLTPTPTHRERHSYMYRAPFCMVLSVKTRP